METLLASPLAIEVFIALLFSVVIYVIAKKWSEHTITSLSGHFTAMTEEVKKANETNDKMLQVLINSDKVMDETIKVLRDLQLASADARRDHQEILKEVVRGNNGD